MPTIDTLLSTPASFTKKVEILRALVRTEAQFANEFKLPDKSVPFCVSGDYKDIDLKLIEEFKKVFSLGTNQLEKFIFGYINGLEKNDDSYSKLVRE